jgi:hypothetical protein
MVLIRRPVSLEVFKKVRPIERESIPLKVLERERKAMIDADQCPDWFCQSFY